MRHLRTLSATGVALLLVLGLAAGSAHAASTVDITYDLSDTDLVWESGNFKFIVSNDDDSFSTNEAQASGIVSGSMKVRYASDSSSGMPIVHGSATLLTFNLTVQSWSIPYNAPPPYSRLVTGTLHWQLISSAAGSFASSSALSGVNANLLMTGRADCKLPLKSYCQNFVGLNTFTVYPSYQRSGAISVAGSAGPYGGAQSTRHTLTGRAPAVGWQPGFGFLGLGSDHRTDDDVGGVYITGREILREADGHETKIIPEPGTLLLLGSGAAGLGLLGRSRRRARRG